jgi:hypothetical protein
MQHQQQQVVPAAEAAGRNSKERCQWLAAQLPPLTLQRVTVATLFLSRSKRLLALSEQQQRMGRRSQQQQ